MAEHQVAQEIEKYHQVIGLDREHLEAAASAWTVIEPHMTDLIDQFYQHLDKNGFMGFFRGHDLPAIKRGQLAYWQRLFTGEFDTNYNLHVNVIREKHAEANVEFTDYIAAYAWFSEQFTGILMETNLPSPYGLRTLLAAVNKVVYLDMMIASGSSDVHLIDF